MKYQYENSVVQRIFNPEHFLEFMSFISSIYERNKDFDFLCEFGLWRISFVPNFKKQDCTKRIVFTNLVTTRLRHLFSEYSWFIHARILPCVYLLFMSFTMTINFVLRILLENCRLKIIFMRVLAVADLKMVTHSWTPYTN